MISTNDVLRSLRYSLNISDAAVVEIFKVTQVTVSLEQVAAWLAKEEDANFQICSHQMLAHFLDGLIIQRRGLPQGKAYEAPEKKIFVSNNMVLKKLRIAFELQEDEMLAILESVGLNVSKHELGALFRKEGHHNYRECGDQFLRNFLKGLTLRLRK